MADPDRTREHGPKKTDRGGSLELVAELVFIVGESILTAQHHLRLLPCILHVKPLDRLSEDRNGVKLPWPIAFRIRLRPA